METSCLHSPHLHPFRYFQLSPSLLTFLCTIFDAHGPLPRRYTGDQFGNLVIVGFSLPDGTMVDQTQCPAVPYTPPYVPPYTPAPVNTPGYGGTNPTHPPSYAAPPTDAYTPPPTPTPTPRPTNAVPNNCNSYIQSKSDLSDYYEALQQTYVNVAIQQPGPYTVFCPTNAAITAYTNGNTQSYYQNNLASLTSLTLKHVFHGAYNSAQLFNGQVLQSLNGPCTVRRYGDYISIMSEDGTIVCNVVGQGYQTMNGYVYEVDNVLAPPSGCVESNLASLSSLSHTLFCFLL